MLFKRTAKRVIARGRLTGREGGGAGGDGRKQALGFLAEGTYL